MISKVIYLLTIIMLSISCFAACPKLTQAADNRYLEIKNMPLPRQYSKPRTKQITHIVIHFTSNARVNPKKPYQIKDIFKLFIDNDVSVHYVIARDGQVYRLVAENRVAYHAGKGDLSGFPAYRNKLNEFSIGIELLAIGTWGEMLPMMSLVTYDFIKPLDIGFTNSQYESLNNLIDAIIKRHPTIKKDWEHIIGHDEYAPERKTDPGKLFDWSRVDL